MEVQNSMILYPLSFILPSISMITKLPYLIRELTQTIPLPQFYFKTTCHYTMKSNETLDHKQLHVTLDIKQIHVGDGY